jgi:hypothetical protein
LTLPFASLAHVAAVIAGVGVGVFVGILVGAGVSVGVAVAAGIAVTGAVGGTGVEVGAQAIVKTTRMIDANAMRFILSLFSTNRARFQASLTLALSTYSI